MSQPDRNLTTALVLGTLRWQIALEDRLLPLLSRPDQALPGAVQTALLLGAFQLEHMDRIPAHAALNESVELVRWAGVPTAAGLVNAVLRKLLATPAAPKQPIYESALAAGKRLGHPGWLVERWARQYGQAAALAICAYDQQEPTLGGLFAAEQTAAGQIAAGQAAADWTAAEQTASAAAAGESAAPAEPGFGQGFAHRMDDGSRLVAEVAAISQQYAKRIWDCCAAPGGKTLVLAERHPDAAMLATDISPRRLQACRDRLQKALPGREIRAEVADAAEADAEGSPVQGTFDLILCDVPCSGTGTLARNPEIRHRLQPEDLPRQAERQNRILIAALARLAPGGKLLYSSCSLEPEENEAVVNTALARDRGVRLEPIAEALHELRSRRRLREGTPLDRLVQGSFLRTLPGNGFQGDGFFAALFTRGESA